MSAGYSGTPLVRKLGVRPGMTCAIVHPPRRYDELVPGLPEDLTFVDASTAGLDFVHLFVTSSDGLDETLRFLRTRIVDNGMIWVSWPKKSSRVKTDVTEDVVRAAALDVGLVDVKVCAVDETWSGLRLVIPVAART